VASKSKKKHVEKLLISIFILLLLSSLSINIVGKEISEFEETDCECSGLPLQLTTSDSGKTTRPQTGRGEFQRLYCVYTQGIHYRVRAELRCYLDSNDAEDDFGDNIESLRDIIAQERNIDNVVIQREEINMDYKRAIFVYRTEFGESVSHSGRLILLYKDTCIIDMDGLSHSEDLIGPLLTLERHFKDLIDSQTGKEKTPEVSKSTDDETYHMFPSLPGPITPQEKIVFSIIDRNGKKIPEDLQDKFSWEIVNNKSISDYIKASIEIGNIDGNGVFTGLNIGTCRLALKYEGKKIDECEITVKCPENVPGDLDAVLELYLKSIPEGPILKELEKAKISAPWKWMSPGSATNMLSHKYSKYDDFVCGGYQKQVMLFLHNEVQANPEQCTLLNGYQFIPIQAERGMHHAVVIFPQGTDWKKTGIVLDPWPTQKPATYSVYNWSVKFPLIGEEVFKSDKGTYSSERMGGALHCPVDILIVDNQGRRMGVIKDGSLVHEIPDAFIMNMPDVDGNNWYFELDPRSSPSYRVEIMGTGNGTFSLVTVNSSDFTLNDYGENPIRMDETAELHISGTRSGLLTLPDGTTITPEVSKIAVSESFLSSSLLIVLAGLSIIIVLGIFLILPRIKSTNQRGLEGELHCPQCGTLLPRDSIFCDNCGYNLQGELHCPQCGTLLPRDSIFCDNCGFELRR
jgi:hypothetical protein